MPPENEEIISVPLFESAHNGYGDELAVAQPHTYNRVFRGFNARTPTRLQFGDYITRLTHSSYNGFNPVYATEWLHTDNSTPCVYYIAGHKVMQIRSGAIAEVGTNALAQLATGGAMHDDGSGVPYLYIAEGFNGNIQRMAVSQTITTATGDIERDKLASISGYLYGSVLVASGHWCGISFVPPLADPFTEANWAPTTFVGEPHYDINNIGQVRGIPVICKPEGIFVFNRSRSIWENRMPAWEKMPHPDNGRAIAHLGPAIIVSQGRGGAVIFDGYTVRDFSPYGESMVPGIDTTPQTFSCFGIAPDGLLASTTVNNAQSSGSGFQLNHNRVFGNLINSKLRRRGGSDDDGASILGARFFKTTDNGVSYTDYTTQVNDGDFATGANLNALDMQANGDWFIIGHPQPWQAVSFLMAFGSAANTNAATLTAEIWNGSTWTSIAIEDFTRVRTGPNLAAVQVPGLIAFAADPIVAGWQAATMATITSGASADTQSCYYARFSTSAAFSATVTIAEISLMPWRPAIDVTNFPADGMDRAGVYPHLLFGAPRDDGTGKWHDLGAIMTATDTVDDISFLLYANVGGSYGNDINKLVAIGRRGAYIYEIGGNIWPFISPQGLGELPFIRPAQGKLVRLRSVQVLTENAHGVSNIWFYYRYNANERWSRLSLGQRGHATIEDHTGHLGGPDFQWAVGYSMTLDTTLRRPEILRVEADFQIIPDPADARPRRPIATPARG